ncbi:ComF family protein [Candidatus Saccharibacteria bacterium]|nr:ComF family protein [Candidatus Saccharibacteria bacterium]
MPINVNNTTFASILDLLSPHSCRGCGRIGDALCDHCKKYILDHHQNLCPICKNTNASGTCPHCNKVKSHDPLPPTFILGERSDLLAALIHDYKYKSVRPLAHHLADMIDQILPPFTGPTFIVPLPTIHRHVRERGFDHTLLIARHLARKRPNFSVQKALIRTDSKVQVGSNMRDRKAQANSAYEINHKAKLDPLANYILLDDVWTTGASLKAATKKLRSCGVSKTTLSILALSRLD